MPSRAHPATRASTRADRLGSGVAVGPNLVDAGEAGQHLLDAVLAQRAEMTLVHGGVLDFLRPAMGLDQALIISDSVDENLYLATRNLASVYVVEPSQVDPVSLVHFKNVVITREAIKQIEEMYA